MLGLIDDEVVSIRESCYKGLIRLVGFWEDTQVLLGLDTMTRLVDKLVEEKEEGIQGLNLKLINLLLNNQIGVD